MNGQEKSNFNIVTNLRLWRPVCQIYITAKYKENNIDVNNSHNNIAIIMMMIEIINIIYNNDRNNDNNENNSYC